MKSLLSLMFFLVSIESQAAVWESDKVWDDKWQSEYSNWISTKVGPRFFKELGKPFSTLKIDCADAHYGFMAYFARQNGIDFSVNKGEITNETTRYDHIKDKDEKLVAFINLLSASYGTESLSHNDTYPVGIKNVQPGDLFMYKIGGGDSGITRHAYIVKNINVDGTFAVLYSTQAARDEGRPLNQHLSYMFKKAPFNTGVDYRHWGFRRAKNSNEVDISQEDLEKSDFSQYELASKLLKTHGFSNGKLHFFREVRRVNRTVSESPNRVSQRNFNNICSAVQNRVPAVQDGVNHSKKLNGKCMNFSDYDIYSTPSRDSGIIDDYRNYQADIEVVDKNALNDKNKKTVEALFRAEGPTDLEAADLKASCEVVTSVGAVDLGTFRKNLFQNKVSYHPNDNIYRRWGEEKGPKTRCEEYYGYPSN